MLETRQLAVAYGQHRALKGVDLHVAAGEIVVILGANGAGKTTLLKAVAGLVPCGAASQVTLDGRAITHASPHRIVEAGLALVPEGRGIFGDLTVRENLLLGAFAHRARDQQANNLQRVLALFPKLAERSAQQARTMSGGEQQMVAIGRALMSAPTILMLDEPSLGLSPLLCIELFKALRSVRDTGVGILLVEQNARQSLAIADRAYLLENGEIVGQGAAEQLARDPAVQAAYLGGAAAKAPLPAVGDAAPAPASPASPAAPARATPVAPEMHKSYVTTLPASQRSVSADALIPTRIADLVRVAARVQAHDVERARQRPAAPPAAEAGSASARLFMPAAAPGRATDPGAGLAEALAQVEAAAARARQPAAPAPAPAIAAPPDAAYEPLPTIEVYRRPTIEIYRRDRDGQLTRQPQEP